MGKTHKWEELTRISTDKTDKINPSNQ